MLNKKSVQNSESNYLSNALWNFQPKNEENGSQTSNNNSPSKNNPIENMDIETIKLNEKDDENDDYMNNIEQNKDLNEIKNEPIAFMEIESESEQDKQVEIKKEKKIEKEQSVPIKKLDETVENNEEKNFKNLTESKIEEKRNSKFIENTETNKNLPKKVIFKVVKPKSKIDKKESIDELITKYNEIDDNNNIGENEKLLVPIQTYEQHEENPLHMQTKSISDEILEETKCNFDSIVSSNQNTNEVSLDRNNEVNEGFRNRVNFFGDEQTCPYSKEF